MEFHAKLCCSFGRLERRLGKNVPGGGNVPILILMLGLNRTKVLYPTMNVPLHTPITVCYMSIVFPFIFWLLYKRKNREIWQTVVGAE